MGRPFQTVALFPRSGRACAKGRAASGAARQRNLYLFRLCLLSPASRWSPRGDPLICEHGERWPLRITSQQRQMSDSSQPRLSREIGLREVTALNMIDMIGVGPFVTIPLIVGAMGGPQAMLGWVLGAFFAVCD